MGIAIKLVSADDFYKILTTQNRKTNVPFADSDDTDWHWKPEQRGQYWVAFDGKKLIAAFKFYQWKRDKDEINQWLEKNGHPMITGNLYQGSYIGVHPDYRRQGLGTKLNNAVLGMMKPGDVFQLGTHEPDGKLLNQKWLSEVNGKINILYGKRYTTYLEYDPTRVNYVVTDDDSFGRVASKKEARSYTRITMFDFDGTLFRSWEKTPDWWTDQTPYSFFIQPVSLDDPCVPDRPGSEYWIHGSVAGAKEAMRDAGTYMVLITGRVKSHEPRVKELLSQVGIRFDRMYFNPGMSAVAFKKKVLGVLLASYNTVNRVDVWENENMSNYNTYLQTARTALERDDVRVTVHNVDVPPIPLTCGPKDFGLSEARVASRWMTSARRPVIPDGTEKVDHGRFRVLVTPTNRPYLEATLSLLDKVERMYESSGIHLGSERINVVLGARGGSTRSAYYPSENALWIVPKALRTQSLPTLIHELAHWYHYVKLGEMNSKIFRQFGVALQLRRVVQKTDTQVLVETAKKGLDNLRQEIELLERGGLKRGVTYSVEGWSNPHLRDAAYTRNYKVVSVGTKTCKVQLLNPSSSDVARKIPAVSEEPTRMVSWRLMSDGDRLRLKSLQKELEDRTQEYNDLVKSETVTEDFEGHHETRYERRENEWIPTDYSRKNMMEWWAEILTSYIVHPSGTSDAVKEWILDVVH